MLTELKKKNEQSVAQLSNFIINIDNIISLSRDLAQILHQENKLLDKMSISGTEGIEGLQQQKSKIIDLLEVSYKFVINNPHLFEFHDKNKLEELKQADQLIQQLMQENIAKINKAMIANNKIVEMIKFVYLEQAEQQTGYNKQGSYGGKFNSVKEMPPLTIKNEI